METTVFKNCKDCKANAKCCAQLGENFQLNGPIVTEKEIKIIDGQIVDHQLWFEIINQIKGRKTYSIKTNNNGQCVFYKNNKCEIYEVRPFDCRIFPLDIFMINSKYYWVCYTKFCEKKFDWSKILAFGQTLLNSKENGFLEYFAVDVEHNKPSLSYKILAEICITKNI